MQAFMGMLIFLRTFFDDYMISLLRIVMLQSFLFPCNYGYKAVVGSNCIFNCCQILDALLDSTEAFVNICDTAVMVLAMLFSPQITRQNIAKQSSLLDTVNIQPYQYLHPGLSKSSIVISKHGMNEIFRSRFPGQCCYPVRKCRWTCRT